MSNKVQYLHNNSDGYYYFRRKIPVDLNLYFPSNQIRKSLKTKCLKTAKVNIKVWSFRVEKLFTLMRSGMFTFEQLQKIAQDFFHDFLKTDWEERFELGVDTFTLEVDGQTIPATELDNMCDLEYELKHNEHEALYLDPFLKKRNIKIKDESQYKILSKLIEDALREARKVMIDRDNINLNNKYDRNTDKLYDSKPNTIQASNTEEDKGELFSTVVKGYIKEKQLAESWTIKTKDENQASFDLFALVMGDKPVKTFNRQDFMKFRDTLV